MKQPVYYKWYSNLLPLFLIFVFFGSYVRAADVLYYSDYVVGTDLMREALGELPETDRVVVSSTARAFENQLIFSKYDLVILVLQDEPKSPSDYPQFRRYVEKGGRVIFSDANKNGDFARLMGITYTRTANQSALYIYDKELSVGIDQNPIMLRNTGYHVWSVGVKEAGRSAALFSNTDGAIVMPDSSKIVNAFAVDTPADKGAGVQLFANEISYLLRESEEHHDLPNDTLDEGVVEGIWNMDGLITFYDNNGTISGLDTNATQIVWAQRYGKRLIGWWKSSDSTLPTCGKERAFSGAFIATLSDDFSAFSGMKMYCNASEGIDEFNSSKIDTLIDRDFDQKALEDYLLEKRSFSITGVFGEYDFEDATDAFDWVLTTLNGVSYQLQGHPASASDIFGWERVEVSSASPQWYMVALESDFDDDGTQKFDWLLIGKNSNEIYKLIGVDSSGNFKYSSKFHVYYEVDESAMRITFSVSDIGPGF